MTRGGPESSSPSSVSRLSTTLTSLPFLPHGYVRRMAVSSMSQPFRGLRKRGLPIPRKLPSWETTKLFFSTSSRRICLPKVSTTRRPRLAMRRRLPWSLWLSRFRLVASLLSPWNSGTRHSKIGWMSARRVEFLARNSSTTWKKRPRVSTT